MKWWRKLFPKAEKQNHCSVEEFTDALDTLERETSELTKVMEGEDVTLTVVRDVSELHKE